MSPGARAGSAAPLRPEDELLLACARTQMDPATAGRLRALLERELDWDDVLRAARWHGVLPLVSWHLREVEPGLLPGSVRERLKEYPIGSCGSSGAPMSTTTTEPALVTPGRPRP